jgi:MFS transporter, FHS family, glucose/mannose:H+ symporter
MVGNALGAFTLRKISLYQLLAFSMLLMGVGLWGLGLAPRYEIYLVAALIFGLSMGGTGVAQNLMIAENVKQPYQTKALAGLHSVYGLSSLMAPFVASRAPKWFEGGRISLLEQWQSAFFLTGTLALVVLLLILFSRPNPIFQHHDHKSSPSYSKKGVVTMLWFAGFFASYVGAEILVSTRLALYMRTYFHFDLESSSNYVTYFFVFLLAGRFLFALKSFKWPLKTQMNASLVLSFVTLVLGLWLHPFFLALAGLTMAPFYPLALVYISEKTGLQKRRYLTFVMGMQSLFVIFMHIGVGYVTDTFSLFYAFGIGLVLLAGSLLCLNLHPELAS